jgi:hypothetical protein
MVGPAHGVSPAQPPRLGHQGGGPGRDLGDDLSVGQGHGQIQVVHLHQVGARRCIFLFLSSLSQSPQTARDDGLRLVPQAAGLSGRERCFEQGALDLSIGHRGQGVGAQQPGVEQLLHQVLQYGVGAQVGGGAMEAGLGHDELDQQFGRLDVRVQVGGLAA